MIACIAVNNLNFIGKDNKLLWESSEDLAHFKAMSMDKVMLVGYNTWTKLPKVVKNRPMIIDQRENGKWPTQNFTVKGDREILCVGGKKTYEKYCHLFTELHISHIDNNAIGDCTFPDLSSLNPACKIINYFFKED